MGLKKATAANRLFAFFDWKEEWREYYCRAGKEHWIAPERFWDYADEHGCPHCGGELVWTEYLVQPEDYTV